MFSFYEILSFFAIYSILGWCGEVIFAAACLGKFVNRGFLNGIVCPIYGFGVVIGAMCLTPIRNNLILLFIGSVVLTSIIEFITGFILEKFFKLKWWDYTDEPFNIKGYICLKFSLLWGFAFVFVMKIIHPIISNFVNFVPHAMGWTIICVFYTMLITDFLITLISILKIKKQMKILAVTKIKLLEMSNSIGGKLSTTTLKGMSELSELSEKGDDLKKKFAEEYAKIIEKNKNGFVFKRLKKAYPKLSKINFKDLIEKVEEYIKSKKD